MKRFNIILTILLCLSSWLTAQTGTYLHFDGSDDYISVNGASVPSGSGNRTVEFTIKPETGFAQNLTILSWGSEFGPSELFRVGLTSGPAGPNNFIVTLNYGNNETYMAMNSVIPAGTWHHVAITYDGTALKIYVDGVLKDTTMPTLNTSNMLASLSIGSASAFNANQTYKGGLDEVRIWNIVRSESEINANKSNQLCGSESGLTSYYKLNDGIAGQFNSSITAVTDNSSSNKEGTLNGFAKWGTTSNFLDGSPVTASVEAPKANPASVVYVKDATASALSAQGQNLKWYTSETGGTGSTSAPTPSTATVGKTSYWVSQTLCGTESSRAKITVYTFASAATANTLHFDGVNDYVSGTNSQLPIGLPVTGTFEFRVKTMKQNCDIFAYGNLSFPNSMFGISISNNALMVTNGGPSNPSDGSSMPVSNNQWHHVTVVLSNSKALYYIDGTFDKEVPFSANISEGLGGNPKDFKIGTKDGATNFFEGQFDEFRVWNRALSASEITNNYNKELCSSSVNGLVAYYRINQGIDGGNNSTMNYLIDDSPSGVEATLNGFGLTSSTSNFVSGSPYLSVPKPTVTMNTFSTCQNAVSPVLEAIGENLKWYTTETGGTGVTTTPIVSTYTAGVTEYWVSQTTCLGESDRTKITVTILAKPDAPTPSSNNVLAYCIGATPTPLTATGTNLYWNSSTFSTSFTPTTSAVGIQSISVKQVVNGCPSDNVFITVTINDLPAAPSVSAVSYCLNTIATPLTATGENLKWYTAATGGTASTVAPTPSTTTVGTTSRWVTQTNSNGCEGPRAKLDVTVINNPSLDCYKSYFPDGFCQNSVVNLGSYITNPIDLKYYTTATGGTASTSGVVNTATLGTTSYWVTRTEVGKCESPRLKFDVSVKDTLTALPTVVSTYNYCQFATASQLSTTGNAVRWYTAATGGVGDVTGGPTPSTSVTGTTSYYVTQQNYAAGYCESNRAKIDVIVSAPAAPTATGAQYFQDDKAAPLTANGTNLKWYTTATGGTASTTAITPSTDNAGIVSYYVSQTSTDNCEGPRTKIDIPILGKGTHLNFDGVNDYCKGTFNNLPGSNTARTIEMMIKTDQTTTASLLTYGYDPDTDFKIRMAGGTLQVGQGSTYLLSTANVNDNVWHHLAVVFDGTTLKIYIDGVEKGSVGRTLSTFTSSGAVINLGAYADPNSADYLYFYKGDLDELRIWNKALTVSEINAHRLCEYLSPYPTELVLYHKLNYGWHAADNKSINIKSTVPGTASLYDLAMNNFAKTGTTSNFLAGSPIEIFNAVVVSTPSVSYAQFATAQPLTATGINLKWYTTETGGTALVGTPTPSTTTRGTTTYWVASSTTNGCESVRKKIDVIINYTNATNVHFDGANDEVKLPTGLTIIPASGDARTIEFMVKTTATSGMMFNYGKDNWSGIDNYTNGSFKILLSSGKVSFSNGATTWNTNTTVNDGQWHHVAVSYFYSGSTGYLKVYVDGIAKVNANDLTVELYTRSPYYADAALTIGSANGSNYFAGQIDELRVWNTVRTPTQISSSLKCEIAPNESGLVLYYNFNQGLSEGDNTSITTITDATSNAAHGAMNNFAKTGTTSNFLTTSKVFVPTAPILAASVCNLCQGSTATALTAIGNDLKWYTVETGGSVLSTAPIPNTTTIGTTSYWVGDANTLGCEGSRSKIDVTINASSLASANNFETFNRNTFDCYQSITCDKQSVSVSPVNTGAIGYYPVVGNINSSVFFESTQPASYIKRHHEVTPATNPDISSGIVTLYYTQADFNDFNAVITDATKKIPTSASDVMGKANFRVKKYSGTSADGSLSGYSSMPIIINPSDDSIVWNNAVSRWEVSLVVNGFSGFFGTNEASTVLPIELISFTGVTSEGINHLSWKTASELDNKGFNIERSADGQHFITLDFVAGAGTIQTTMAYNFSDSKPLNGINYYRLKQVDFSGKYAYSHIVALNIESKNDLISVFPNPNNGIFKIMGKNVIESKAIIINTLGQALNIDINNNELNIQHLPTGVYYLKLSDSKKMIKIVKE